LPAALSSSAMFSLLKSPPNLIAPIAS
jgi:hypothetical protein